MSSLQTRVEQFLAQKRIAVAGVSRNNAEAANLIYRKFRDNGYEVFAANPNAEQVEGGAPCYPNLHAIPGGVEAVMIATPPAAAEAVMRECVELGIQHVWMHRSFGTGSVSAAATTYGQSQGLNVIAGGCPLMFLKPDVAHRCMRWVLGVTGKLPTA